MWRFMCQFDNITQSIGLEEETWKREKNKRKIKKLCKYIRLLLIKQDGKLDIMHSSPLKTQADLGQ